SQKVPPPFYKAPAKKTYNYEFPEKDREIKVIQHRFTPRTASASSPQVTEGGQASQVGLKLGDTITKINNVDTSEMTLAEAHAKIEGAEQGVKLSVVSFEDDEEKVAEERQVVLKAKKEAEGPRKLSVVDLEKPKEKTWIPQPERKVWHPIVWQQPPPPVAQENYGPDAPHKRIVRNIRRLLNETEDQPEERWKHIENMLLALPTASKTN
uniref:PDZ domain-containing protein n=1 Tax=Lutzomyia longipalpis TaxID=7200 RepID=A0A1B0CBQ9_LUTLO